MRFLRDSTYAVSDQEVYRAVAARVLPGGQVILASTPWAKSGLLYDMFSANDNKHETAIAVRAPHAAPEPAGWVQEIVMRREMARDADNANREYGAQFMTAGSSRCFDPDLRRQRGRLVQARVWRRAEGRYGPRVQVGQWRPCIVLLRKGIIYPVFSLELRPEEGKPLSPEQTIATFSGPPLGIQHPLLRWETATRETAQRTWRKLWSGLIGDAPTSLRRGLRERATYQGRPATLAQ